MSRMQIGNHGSKQRMCGKRKLHAMDDDDVEDMNSMKTTFIPRPIYKRARFHSISLKMYAFLMNDSNKS